MGKIGTSDLKGGRAILFDNEPYTLVKVEFVSPGKGQAFVRCKMKGIKNGKALDHSFKSTETVESLEVTYKTQNFMYCDGAVCTFMDPDTYDQYEISTEVLGDSAQWLQDGMDVPVQFLDEEPIGVNLPTKMMFTVKQTDPGVKGDTKTNATKPATLDNDVTVNVPMFIETGEKVMVNTDTGMYSERAN